MQNCVFTGVSYSSPTLASAIGQLIPAFTFSLAVIFRFFSFPILLLLWIDIGRDGKMFAR